MLKIDGLAKGATTTIEWDVHVPVTIRFSKIITKNKKYPGLLNFWYYCQTDRSMLEIGIDKEERQIFEIVLVLVDPKKIYYQAAKYEQIDNLPVYHGVPLCSSVAYAQYLQEDDLTYLKEHAEIEVFLTRNQLDIVIVPERSGKYAVQNDRVKFIFDEGDRLGMIRIEDLAVEEYRILKECFAPSSEEMLKKSWIEKLVQIIRG